MREVATKSLSGPIFVLCSEHLSVQSNLDYPDLDYPDFFSGPVFFMNINKL